jgi:hypothetical protein
MWPSPHMESWTLGAPSRRLRLGLWQHDCRRKCLMSCAGAASGLPTLLAWYSGNTVPGQCPCVQHEPMSSGYWSGCVLVFVPAMQ